MAVWWWRSGALLHPPLFILCQCVCAWQTPHTRVAIVLSGLTGVRSESCWLGALWYYTCAAPLPALRSRFPVCVHVLLCECLRKDKDDMITTLKQQKKTTNLNQRNKEETERMMWAVYNSSTVLPPPMFFVSSLLSLFLSHHFCHFQSLHWCYPASLFGPQAAWPAFSPPITYTSSARLT